MKSIFKYLFLIITILIFIICVSLSIAGGVVFTKARNAFIPLKVGYNPIEIYDSDNELISTENCYYQYVSLNNISDHIKNAFVAVEDRDFYEHDGYSIKRIFSAIYTNIIDGSYSSGASTITQQYVKNTILTNEKTLERKANELAYALELEKRYTKDQILEAYLNTILFGSNIYGIQMASKYYFNKDASAINISEAAYLAGMIQAPNRYNAYINPDAANDRKNVVLKCMQEEGYISSLEYDYEKNINISSLLSKSFDNKQISYITPYLDYIYQNINFNDDTINEIYTYLDKNIQYDLYKIMTNEYGLFNDDNLNCAIVVLDNKTYGIKAIMGNRSTDSMVLNYASDVKLQPGSTIKPILDYAPAIEYLGYTPATIINDEYFKYSDGTVLKNYDNNYLGPITLRRALSDSRNVPAVKLFNLVGHDKAFSFANKMGIYSDKYYEADAIGGATTGYTLLSLANAYQSFANLGYYKKVSAISKIEYNTYSWKNDDYAKLIMKPSTAWLINNILHDVFKGSSYDLKNTYLMAKTGQTNYDSKTLSKYNIPYGATKDSLLIGYTKDLTIGIWVGYNQIKEGQYLDRYKKNIPRSIMKIILEKYAQPNNYYEIIDNITKEYITIVDDKAYLSNSNGYYEYFEKGTEPLSYPNKYQTI